MATIMTGENIVCFAKDWGEDPTSNNHVMRRLAQNNRVLWLNSVTTRTANLKKGRDLRKIGAKVVSFLHGLKQEQEGLWTFTPLVLPFPHNRLAVTANRFILWLTIAILRRRLKMREFQLWTFVPTAAEYMDVLGAKMSVYYCTDNYSSFGSVDGEKMEKMITKAATQADVVFATSRPLVEKLRPLNANVYLASHGVDHAQFAKALDESTPLPEDIAALPHPVLGYYGLIEDWSDLALAAYLAETHPEWSLVYIGKKNVDTSALDKYSNIHFLGRKQHAELPAYCKAFDVALIPHKVNDLTRHMNPIKLREYISAGLQVVSTALPEMRHYPEHCIVAESYAEFEAGVEKALRSNTLEAQRRRSDEMRSETWEQKVAELCERVLRVQAMKVDSHRLRKQEIL